MSSTRIGSLTSLDLWWYKPDCSIYSLYLLNVLIGLTALASGFELADNIYNLIAGLTDLSLNLIADSIGSTALSSACVGQMTCSVCLISAAPLTSTLNNRAGYCPAHSTNFLSPILLRINSPKLQIFTTDRVKTSFSIISVLWQLPIPVSMNFSALIQLLNPESIDLSTQQLSFNWLWWALSAPDLGSQWIIACSAQ